jgi:hypothetical protein
MSFSKGVIHAYDAASGLALVELVGSHPSYVQIPAATHLDAGALVDGRRCAVLFFDDSNPRDGVVIALYDTTADVVNAAQILGFDVNNIAPVDGYPLGWKASIGKWAQLLPDAWYLQGRYLDSAAPANGNTLVWDSDNIRWKPAAPAAASVVKSVGYAIATVVSSAATTPQASGITVSITTSVACDIIVVAQFRQRISSASYQANYQVYRDASAIGQAGACVATSPQIGSLTARDANVAAGTYAYSVKYWSSNASGTASCGEGAISVVAVPV